MLTELYQHLRTFTRGLSFRLSFYAGLIVFLALMAFAYYSIKTQEHNLTSKMVQVALKDSYVAKSAIWHGMMTKDREVIREIVKSIGLQGDLGEINIFDQYGDLRYSSSMDKSGKPLTSLDEPLKQSIASVASVQHKISDDGRWLSVVNPLYNTKSCYTAACHYHPKSRKTLGALAIKLPIDDLREEIYAKARTTVVFAFFLFILISSIIGLAVIFLVNPSIRRLQENALKVAGGQYEPQDSPVDWFDDIASLNRSFSQMTRSINERTAHLDSRRKFWKSLYEGVPCYLTTVNREYRITTANKTFREMFGEQVGKNCYVGYKGADSKCKECPVEKTFIDGQSHRSEERWKHNGRDVYVIVQTAPVFNDNGGIGEVLEMSLDVTKLKELQMELDKQKELYKNLFEHIPCYLTVVDTDFNIIQTNNEFQTAFGSQIGEKCYEAYKGLNTRCEDCPVAETFQDGKTHTSEHVWYRDGQPIHIVANTSPITDEQGNVVAAIEMCTDITEMKRLQNELAILGETVAGMSHTIKNILAGLEGGVYMVDSGFEHNNEDRMITGWAMVKRNVGKVSELVKGILYTSKDRQPDYQECDPGELLADVYDLYKEKAKSEGINLIRDFDIHMPKGMLDPSGIHSVVSNLVSNAIEACRGLDDETYQIRIGGRVKDGKLLIEVEDNGPGMDEQIKARLFERFYSTKGSKGTGLGLVLTRKVIHEHGGTIDVDTAPGLGALFSLKIPFRPKLDESGLRTAV